MKIRIFLGFGIIGLVAWLLLNLSGYHSFKRSFMDQQRSILTRALIDPDNARKLPNLHIIRPYEESDLNFSSELTAKIEERILDRDTRPNFDVVTFNHHGDTWMMMSSKSQGLTALLNAQPSLSEGQLRFLIQVFASFLIIAGLSFLGSLFVLKPFKCRFATWLIW